MPSKVRAELGSGEEGWCEGRLLGDEGLDKDSNTKRSRHWNLLHLSQFYRCSKGGKIIQMGCAASTFRKNAIAAQETLGDGSKN